ncbi:LysE family translocator [Parathalassolituus penaei]|uniref:LysE family translocator n=1 Tax=Parathalassolituus penaei TaxID=2997323 RepID=A0A9X3ELS6_9GAMM|nr:LysE family translocator [Parathalassolituus penaei]MCY0966706.1 LysE family translocator [Parathalassolituus penaei]
MVVPESIGLFALTSLALALAPGPDNLFVVAQSAMAGRRSGWAITLGLCTGLLVHTSLVVVGVAALIQASHIAFTTLKVAGALYLLWLAVNSWRAGHTGAGFTQSERFGRLYRRGILMNITNPKVTIFFLAFLPQFVDVEAGSVASQTLVLGAVFILVSLLTFGLLAVLAGRLHDRFVHNPDVQKGLNRVAALVFVGLAANLLAGEVNS